MHEHDSEQNENKCVCVCVCLYSVRMHSDFYGLIWQRAERMNFIDINERILFTGMLECNNEIVD